MSALCFAKAHGLPYVHRPFTTIEHAETDMPAWVRSGRTISISAPERRASTSNGAGVVALDHLRFMPRQEPVIVAAEHYLRYCNQDNDAWERVLPLLRAKFWQNKTAAERPASCASPCTCGAATCRPTTRRWPRTSRPTRRS